MISLSFAVLHASIELMFINLEKKANKTTMMHYLIICFNGRFGYVPFTQYFASNTDIKDLDTLNYDDISSSMCCIYFNMEYDFTEDTILGFMASLSNLPERESFEQKIKVVAGKCLNKISMVRFK